MDFRRHLAIAAGLAALAALVQLWSIRQAPAPALDAVRFVALAQRMAEEGILATARAEHEQPLFPALICLAQRAARAWLAGEDRWVLCAQATAGAMLVLSVLPVYFLLLRAADARVALGGSLFYLVMTEVASLGASALSDSTSLCFLALAYWAVARYWLPTPAADAPLCAARPAWLAVSGACTGLALMARPEALVLLPALLASLLVFQLRPAWRQPWRQVVLAACSACLGLAVVVTPYLAVIDSLRPQAAVGRLLGRPTSLPAPSSLSASGSTTSGKSWRLASGEAMSFSLKETSASRRFTGYPAALREYLHELPKTFHYWIGGLALLGAWTARRRLTRPLDRFALMLMAAYSLAAVAAAARLGYLSPRHLLPLVIPVLSPAAVGALEAGRWLAEKALSPYRGAGLMSPSAGSWAVVLLAALACLPQTLAPQHASRLPHRQAGRWLAAAPAPGLVLDTRGWTGLYSGRPTLRYDAAKRAFRDPGLAYVVVEQRELGFNSPRSRTLAELLQAAAEPAATFPSPSRRRSETVVVYRWYPERFRRDLRQPRHNPPAAVSHYATLPKP